MGAPAACHRGLHLRTVIQLLAMAFVVHVFVLPQLGGARDALDVVGQISPELMATAIALETCAIVAYAQLTRSLFSPHSRPPLAACVGVVLASTGINHMVPGGAATTAAVNYRLFGLAGVPRAELTVVLGIQAIGSAAVLNLLLWVALLISIPTSGFHPIYATAAAAGAVSILVFALAVLGLLRGQDRLAGWARRVAGRVPKLDPRSVEQTLDRIADQLHQLGEDRRRLATAGGLATANWLLDASALGVILLAFGHRTSLVGLLVAYGLANVMAAIPITPGGLGVVEAVLIPTLIGFGTPVSVAAVGVVAYRVVSFWLPIPIGLAAYVIVERHLADHEQRVGVRPVLAGLTGRARASDDRDE